VSSENFRIGKRKQSLGIIAQKAQGDSAGYQEKPLSGMTAAGQRDYRDLGRVRVEQRTTETALLGSVYKKLPL